MLDRISVSELNLMAQTPEQWLFSLSRPVAIEIPGKDTSRCRVVSVLIHGNEPSGFFAVYEFIKKEVQPVTNLSIVISSIRAAKVPPVFSHRVVPGEFDLNRRFGVLDCHNRVTELARHITEYIRSLCPEVIIDLHNTSGNGPAFSVSISDHPVIRQVATLFSEQMIVTQLNVGSLMEQNFNCPVVTVECGGAEDPVAHRCALDGLLKFSQLSLRTEQSELPMKVYMHPVRVKAVEGVSLTYERQENSDFDLTLLFDIEKFNNNVLPIGASIGWVGRELADCLTAIDDFGYQVVHNFFAVKDNQIIAKQALQIFMATARRDIALSDCLFYVVAVERTACDLK